MQEHASRGQAAYALVQNTIIQAQSRTAYWVSGGACSPGTSSTEITTKVDQGQVNINGSPVNFTGGEPAHPPADSKPRVDVVSVTATGDFDVTAGTPEDFAPTEDEDGNPIESHTPFHHWTPSPDAGSNTQGVPLALVLTRPDTTAGTDLTEAEVNDDILRIEGASQSAYVKGDGTDNGPTTITVNDADFAVQDQTDGQSKYLWRDHDQGDLNIGSPNAQPTLGAPLDANSETLSNVTELDMVEPGNIDFRSADHVFAIRDQSTNADVLEDDGSATTFQHSIDYSGKVGQNFGGVDVQGPGPMFRHADSALGTLELWKLGDGAVSPEVYTGRANPSGGVAFALTNQTANQILFRVMTDGQLQATEGGLLLNGRLDVGGGNVRNAAWVGINSDTPGQPDSPGARIYKESGSLKAIDQNGSKITLGTF